MSADADRSAATPSHGRRTRRESSSTMTAMTTTPMTTPITTTPAHPAPGAAAPPNATGSPRWAVAGWLAGALAVPVYVVVTGALAVSTDDFVDNQRVLDALDGAAGWVWAFQTGSVAIALLVTVFGLGLRRRLAGQTPAGSLLPDLAAAGMLLVSALTLVGGGISTEMFHSLRHADEVDPDTVAAHLAIFNTMAWVWAGGILTTGATAVAGLRHGAIGRKLSIFAAAMTVLIALTQLVPLQYLAVLPVTLFLVVGGVALQRDAASEAGLR
jgi:membrane-associated protease RseP (regulator of RpoE activity)